MAKEESGAMNIGKAAETAAVATKAAIKVAQQDYVGAAASVVTSETGRRIIAGVLIFALLIPVLFLFALPVMMFETVVAFFDNFVEWCGDVASAGDEAYQRSIIAGLSKFTAMKNSFEASVGKIVTDIGGAIAEGISWLWGKVKGLFVTSNSSSASNESREISRIDEDRLSDDGEELYIVGDEGAQYNTLKDNLNATKAAMDERMADMVTSLESVEGTVRGIFRGMYESTYGSYPQRADYSSLHYWTSDDIYNGDSTKKVFYEFDDSSPCVNVMTGKISDLDAARLMTIYTVIRGANISDITISDYQKWLGYEPDYLFKWIAERKAKNQVVLDIGLGDANPHVTKWVGTCLPQYLYDRAKYEKDTFGREVSSITGYKSCAAMDLLLTISDPGIYSTLPTISEGTETVTVHRKMFSEKENIVTETDPETGEERQTFRIDPKKPDAYGAEYHDGFFFWQDTYTEEIPIVRVSYRTTITVGTRSTEDILSILGVKGSGDAVGLEMTDERAKEVWNNLPANISAERKEVLRYALSLVGKVKYFWGGKSYVLGTDPRWGKPTVVTSTGSPTTGTTRPYGLDCSGFVDWAFFNQSKGSFVISDYGGCKLQHQKCVDITWDEAYPGDLVFYEGDEHIGIVCGWDDDGNILIVHCCSGSLNGVVITGRYVGSGGFQTVGRPTYYRTTTSAGSSVPAPEATMPPPDTLPGDIDAPDASSNPTGG